MTPPTTASTSARRPNVVIIYTDDLGYGDLGCYGADDLATPHLDALAERGIRATDWYSNAPVCSPSRAALLTGCHPARTGVTHILGGGRSTPGLSPEHPTLARMLSEQGYRTGLFGKWHLGVRSEHRPGRHGFDEFFGFLAGCVDYYSHIFYWGQAGGVDPAHDLWDDDVEVWHNGDYLTDLITDRAVDFIERHADQSFFAYLPYNAPHYPMHAPQHYLDRFPDLPADRRIMAAMIAAVDDGVGRVVETLRQRDLLDDTVIIFSSDNGPSAESRNWLDGTSEPWHAGTTGGFRGHKGSLFDGGIREPFLISYPRSLPAGVTFDDPAQMCDVVPTVLALAGLDPVDGLDGQDISAALSGAAPVQRRLFWSQDDQLAVRDGNWKLVLNPRIDLDHDLDERVFLSDLGSDPGEQHNLVHNRPELSAELQNAVTDWYATLN